MATAPVHLFDTAVSVFHRVTGTSQGSVTEAYGTAAFTTTMRIQPRSNPDSFTGGATRAYKHFNCYCRSGLDIRRTDRITFTDKTSGSDVTRTLEVQDIRNPQQVGTLMYVDATEVET